MDVLDKPEAVTFSLAELRGRRSHRDSANELMGVGRVASAFGFGSTNFSIRRSRSLLKVRFILKHFSSSQLPAARIQEIVRFGNLVD